MTTADEEGKNFEVVAPPVGATVPYLPEDTKDEPVLLHVLVEELLLNRLDTFIPSTC